MCKKIKVLSIGVYTCHHFAYILNDSVLPRRPEFKTSWQTVPNNVTVPKLQPYTTRINYLLLKTACYCVLFKAKKISKSFVPFFLKAVKPYWLFWVPNQQQVLFPAADWQLSHMKQQEDESYVCSDVIPNELPRPVWLQHWSSTGTC